MSNKVIYWQYPGEELNRIIGADSFIIEPKKPMFEYAKRRGYIIRAKAVVAADVPPRGEKRGEDYGKFEVIDVHTLGYWDAPIWSVVPDYNSLNVHWNITYTQSTQTNSFSAFCKEKTIRIIPRTRKDGVYSGAVLRTGGYYDQPGILNRLGVPGEINGFFDWKIREEESRDALFCRNELPQRCIFRVYDRGIIVYEREEVVCPIAWEEVPECPPGTCPVDCHGKVCCYNSQGISVYSYLK